MLCGLKYLCAEGKKDLPDNFTSGRSLLEFKKPISYEKLICDSLMLG